MLIPFLDAELNSTIYVNPEQVAVVFEGKNADGKLLTMINLLNGNVATEDSISSVVFKLNNKIEGVK